MVGKTLSHYRLVEKVGEGGMGVVWRAEDTVLGRTVAIKVLPADLALDEGRRQLFLNEARLAASLSHAHIAQVHDLGREGDLDFIVMEYVEGQPLNKLLHGRPLPPDKVAEIGLQVAEGLARAHRKDLIHRDLKPANILITSDGDVKIVDFGLAMLFTRAESTPTLSATLVETTTGSSIAGTLPYMSPEQVRGEQLDARSDIFSFGTVLYEMTTGRRPFQGASPAEIAQAILGSRPTPVHELLPEVPITLDQAIEKALARNPRDRYQVMDDVAVDLRRLARDLESSSSPSYSDLRQGPLRGRRRRAGVIAMVTTVAVAAMAIYGLGHRRSSDENGTGAFQSMQMRQLTTTGNIMSAALSPDGRFLAQLRLDGGSWSLWVQQVATGSEVEVVPGQKGEIGNVSFSPNGEYLYYLARDYESFGYSALFQVPSLGGPPRKVLFDVDTAVTLSPDGSQIAFVRGFPDIGETALMVANADGSSERKLAVERQPLIYDLRCSPSWSPDGRRIAAVVSRGLGDDFLVTVAVADGGSTTLSADRWIAIEACAWLPDNSSLVLSGLSRGASLNTQIWEVAYPSGEVWRITNDLDNYTGVSITRDAKQIATVQSSLTANLWVAPAADPSAARQITSISTVGNAIGNFAVASDGRIVFVSKQDRFLHLFSVRGDGSDRRQLTSGPSNNIQPSVTSAGGVVVFTSIREKDNLPHVFKMDLDGSNLVQLTNGSSEFANSVDPQGRWALYTTFDPAQTVRRVSLSGGPSSPVGEPFSACLGYSPDGERIALLSFSEQGGRVSQLLTVIPATGGAPLMTRPLPRGVGVQTILDLLGWAPTGDAFDYVQEVDGKWNLWRQSLEGGQPRRLTDFSSLRIYHFQWSPDGKQLVLSRGETRRDVVAISNAR